jgi:hypothetical protein
VKNKFPVALDLEVVVVSYLFKYAVMSDYQKEQAESLAIVRKHLRSSNSKEKETLIETASEYFSFRKKVDSFLLQYFGKICNLKCYQSRLSACCGREGIITFFADMVINALVCSEQELDKLDAALSMNNKNETTCVYLGDEGCLWKVKPIVCEMFLCDAAMKEIFEEFPEAALTWKQLKQREKHFKWPDKPVLFDYLEEVFLAAGYCSPLMYLHNSPGLLRIKKQAGML